MGGWVKEFSDGTPFEMGTDADIRNGKASWLRGKLDHIAGVSVKSGDQHIAIKGPGEYWQSDDYEVPAFSSNSTMITRRIMKRLEETDTCFEEIATEHSTMLFVYNIDTDIKALSPAKKIHDLAKLSAGEWLMLEYYIPTKVVRWSVIKSKI